ncbi:hypothetical protein Hanom_Chr15g01369271 [Helianthus anomalus]
MSSFNLNYVFGESSDNNTSTFISESNVGSVVPNSYSGRVIDDHAEELMYGFCSHHMESLLLDLNEVSIYLLICIWWLLCLAVIKIAGVRVMKTIMVPPTDKKTMAITFSLVTPRTYNKTLVSILTPNSQWVTSNSLTRKFRTKLIRYE